VKGYVRNTINVSCAKILLTSVIEQDIYFTKENSAQTLETHNEVTLF